MTIVTKIVEGELAKNKVVFFIDTDKGKVQCGFCDDNEKGINEAERINAVNIVIGKQGALLALEKGEKNTKMFSGKMEIRDADKRLQGYQKAILAEVKRLKELHKENKAACENAIKELNINEIIRLKELESIAVGNQGFNEVIVNLVNSHHFKMLVKELREKNTMSEGALAPNKIINIATGEQGPRAEISDLALYMTSMAQRRELEEESGIKVNGRVYALGRVAALTAAQTYLRAQGAKLDADPVQARRNQDLAAFAAILPTVEKDPYSRSMHFVVNVGDVNMQALADAANNSHHEEKFTVKFVPWEALEETIRVTNLQKGEYAVSDGKIGHPDTRDIRTGSDLAALLGIMSIREAILAEMKPVEIDFARRQPLEFALQSAQAALAPAIHPAAPVDPVINPQSQMHAVAYTKAPVPAEGLESGASASQLTRYSFLN